MGRRRPRANKSNAPVTAHQKVRDGSGFWTLDVVLQEGRHDLGEVRVTDPFVKSAAQRCRIAAVFNAGYLCCGESHDSISRIVAETNIDM